MENRIKKVMANVFSVDESTIGEDASPETIPAWDSMFHIYLLVALEEEFELSFENEIIPGLFSYRALKETIGKKIKR
jgi:acyl carrier protein